MPLRNVCDMGGTGGSGIINVQNIRGWYVERAGPPDEDGNQIDLMVRFLTGGGSPKEIVSYRITVSDTVSDQLTRNASPTSISDLVIKVRGVSTPGAFSALMAVNGATRAIREKGVADALIAANVIATNLRGPTS